MSVFETQRPVDANTKLNNSIELLRTRKANRTALLEAMKEEQKSAETKKQLEDMDKEEHEKEVKEGLIAECTSRRTNAMKEHSLITLESRLKSEGYKKIFDTAIFEMAFNALWIDDSVKRTPDNIKAMFENYVEIKENVNNILPQCKDSAFISEVRHIVTETVDKAVDRIVAEAKCEKEFKDINELDNINFELTDEEDKDMTDKLSDLGSDDIIQLVKDKVLSVVQDEQKAGKEKSEMFKEMDDAITADNDNDKSEEGDADNSEDDSPVAKESYSALATRGLRRRIQRGNYSTIFESIMVFNNKDMHNKAVTEGVNVSDKAMANAVLMNTIFHYTVLETLNTLKLYDLSNPINSDKIINLYKNN